MIQRLQKHPQAPGCAAGGWPEPGPAGAARREPAAELPNRSRGARGETGAAPPAALLDADERDSAVLRDSVKLI